MLVYPAELDVQHLVGVFIYIHTPCIRAAKVLTGTFEPPLLVETISFKISCAYVQSCSSERGNMQAQKTIKCKSKLKNILMHVMGQLISYATTLFQDICYELFCICIETMKCSVYDIPHKFVKYIENWNKLIVIYIS